MERRGGAGGAFISTPSSRREQARQRLLGAVTAIRIAVRRTSSRHTPGTQQGDQLSPAVKAAKKDRRHSVKEGMRKLGSAVGSKFSLNRLKAAAREEQEDVVDEQE